MVERRIGSRLVEKGSMLNRLRRPWKLSSRGSASLSLSSSNLSIGMKESGRPARGKDEKGAIGE